MKKFTDTEQVILTAVARNNGAVPTRERSGSKVDPRAYGAAIASLIRKGMLEPRGPAREGDYAKDGQKLVLAKIDTDVETQPPAAKERKTREGTKQALLIEMLKRPKGATIDEIVTATGWQSHTARGAMAGALKKKLGLTIDIREGRDPRPCLPDRTVTAMKTIRITSETLQAIRDLAILPFRANATQQDDGTVARAPRR